MIPRTKFGNCSECNAINTECIKVGKALFCLKCRASQKARKQISRSKTSVLSRKIHKFQKESDSVVDAERSYLISDLDIATSQLVRKKYALSSGIVECYTCGWRGDWKKVDCGHYIPRSAMALRWDLRNLRPQCKKCNQFEYGKQELFSKKLEEEAPGIVDILLEEARVPNKWSRQELKEMLISIRAKLKIIETKFNN